MGYITCFIHDQKGVTTIEYALLLAFIGVGVALAAALLGVAVSGRFDEMTGEVNK